MSVSHPSISLTDNPIGYELTEHELAACGLFDRIIVHFLINLTITYPGVLYFLVSLQLFGSGGNYRSFVREIIINIDPTRWRGNCHSRRSSCWLQLLDGTARRQPQASSILVLQAAVRPHDEVLIPVRCKLDEDISSHFARLADPVWLISHLIRDRQSLRSPHQPFGRWHRCSLQRWCFQGYHWCECCFDESTAQESQCRCPAAPQSSPPSSKRPLRKDMIALVRICTTAGSFRASFRLSLIDISRLDWSGSSKQARSRTVLWSRQTSNSESGSRIVVSL